MNTTLISRDFEWKMVCCKKPAESDFTLDEYKKSVNMAISMLPDDLDIKEIVIETERIRPNADAELQTVIYWRK